MININTANLSFEKAIKKISLTVLILNYNNPKDTVECIKSLLQSTVSFNILLIDNGSSDNSARYIKKYYPKILINKFKKNHGFAGGNNRGFKIIYTKPTKYVLLLNNDMVVEKDAVLNLYDALEQNKDACAGSPLIYYFGLTLPWYAGGRISYFKTGGGINYEKSPITNEIVEVDFATAGALIVRTDLLKKLNGFFEDFFVYHEDDDLFVRIKKTASKILFIPSSLMHHKVNRTIGKRSPLQIYYDTRNKLLFMKRNGRWYHYPTFLIYLFYKNFLWNLGGAIFKPSPGKFSRLKGFWFGIIDFMQNKFGQTERKL